MKKEKINIYIKKIENTIGKKILKHESISYGSHSSMKLWTEETNPQYFLKIFNTIEAKQGEERGLENMKNSFSFKLLKTFVSGENYLLYECLDQIPFFLYVKKKPLFVFGKIAEMIIELDNISFKNFGVLKNKSFPSKDLVIEKLYGLRPDYSKEDIVKMEKFLQQFDLSLLDNNAFCHGDFWLPNILYNVVNKDVYLIDLELNSFCDRNYDYAVLGLSLVLYAPGLLHDYLMFIQKRPFYHEEKFRYFCLLRSTHLLYRSLQYSRDYHLDIRSSLLDYIKELFS